MIFLVCFTKSLLILNKRVSGLFVSLFLFLFPFLGEQPAMVDYMIWPIFPRIRTHCTLGGDGDDLPDTLPTLKAWRARMFEDPSVRSILLPEKAYIEFKAHYRTPTAKFDFEC